MFNFGEEVCGDTPQSGLIFETCLSLSLLFFNNFFSSIQVGFIVIFKKIYCYFQEYDCFLLENSDSNSNNNNSTNNNYGNITNSSSVNRGSNNSKMIRKTNNFVIN